MRNEASGIYKAVTGGLCLLAANAALAGPVYQPPGANLTYGDVTHSSQNYITPEMAYFGVREKRKA